MFKDNHKPSSSFSAAKPSVRSYAWALQIIGVAIAYFITGKLGTFLAIPPGYATAIWPPSGIALAGILIYGYRVWPGIVLGSFLVNLSTSIAGSPSEILVSVTIILAIGSGASLQAVVGAHLARRCAGFPNSLAKEKEVFSLFFFGGILSALINSTLAVSTLVAAGRMPAANFLANWGTWWMGDALGVFIFTPLVLVWAQRPSEPWHNRRLAITLPIIAMFALTTTAVFYEAKNNGERIRLEFAQQAAELSAALEKSISTHLNVLRSLGSFYVASTAVDREAFRTFVAHSLDHFQGIQALGWNPRLPLSERHAFEESLRREGYRNFKITEWDSDDNRLVRAGNRPEYVPVGFIEPYQGNEIALGYDVYSDKLRRDAIDRATDTGEIATTALITLIQEPGNQHGILAFLPIYRKGPPHQTPEERRSNISGYAVAVFRGGDIVTAALKDMDRKGLSYRLIDEGAPPTEQLIFSSDPKELKPLVLQENGLFGRNFSLASSLAIPVGGRSWRIEVVPKQDYFVYHKSDNAWLILLAGLLLTSMVSSFVLVFSGRGNMLRRLVEERTAALAQSEERFRSTFERAPVGVANASPDGCFLEVNQGYCDLVGYSRDELLSMTFMQVTHPDYHQSDADIVKRALAGEISEFNIEKKYVRKDGGVVWGNLSVKLVRHPDGSPDYFVAVVENIDRRKQAEAQMAKSLSLLYATLDSSNDAILVVDLNNTWVLHNQQFIDLWHITDEIIAAKDDSAALSYVLDQLEDADDFLNKVRQLYAAPEASSFDILKFKDGKIIERYSIPQCVESKVVGRVWSFRDITERMRAEQFLQRESEKNLALLRNASDGIHILDTDGNIIEVSDSFCAMLGYRRDEVIGMNVVQWDANFTAAECIQLVKQQFTKQQRSLFETRHRRKDGALIDVEVSGFPLELDGKPVLFNSSRDITKRKAIEESLRKLSLAVEQSPNSVVITDLVANIEYVNEAFVKTTGYSRDEVIGKSLRMLRSGKTPKAIYDDMWGALNSGEAWKGEFTNRRKDGAEYTESALISPVRQPNGKITHFVGVQEDITARKQAESLLQESEKRFRNVADAAPVLIWLSDIDKRCFWFNQVWLDFTGRSMEQELGDGWADGVHPDDLQRCLDIYVGHFDCREPFRMEYRLKRYDGEYRWLHDNGVPRFDVDGSFLGYIGSCIDITDQYLAQNALEKSEVKLRRLFELSPLGIAMTDMSGQFIEFNEAFRRICGYSSDELKAIDYWKLTPKKYEAMEQQQLQSLRQIGRYGPYEKEYQRKDGSIIPLRLNGVLVKGADNNDYIWSIIEDISASKEAEDTLRQAKLAADNANQAKGEFLAKMSHEIRTPMNAIIGLSHLALNEETSPEIRDYLEKISSSSNSLLSILNDILDFSKLEAGRLTIDPSLFDLDQILDNIRNLFADRAKEKRLDFTIDVASDVPRGLVGDTLRLQQVLINLLGNAIKFTERGQVVLKITAQQTGPSQARLLFCVTDTGIGMSVADREKLFQPFSQVDSAITRRFGGTGLGLAISHNLLQLMGSEFSVTSAPGQGSSFSFELVLGVSSLSDQHPSNLPIPAQGDFGKLLAGSRVLVAEDNLINQQVVREFLNLSGIDVEIANNGKEAMALLENGAFDAVLMDMHMPEMDGFEATKLIRSQARFAELPVIALTAGVTKEERERCMVSGADDFIAKPINPKKLIRTLVQWIKPIGATTMGTATAEPDSAKLFGANDLPGFDLHNLLEMIGSNQELAIRLLFTFMESMKNLSGEIEALINAGNFVQAKELAHKIKGASGTIGAMQLYTASVALEAELKDQLSAATFNNFREAFNRTMSVIAALHQPEGLMSLTEGNSEALKCVAIKLDLLLKENDFISEALLNALKPHLRLDQLNLFVQLRKLINDLQYDQARKILRQLAEPSDTQES